MSRIRIRLLQAKESLGLPEAGIKRKDPPLEVFEGARSCQCLIFRLFSLQKNEAVEFLLFEVTESMVLCWEDLGKSINIFGSASSSSSSLAFLPFLINKPLARTSQLEDGSECWLLTPTLFLFSSIGTLRSRSQV